MSSKLLNHRAALCNMVRRIAVDAGEAILDHSDQNGIVIAQIKADGSPVTEADQKAEAMIEAALKDILPDVPMVGEEGVEAGRTYDLENAEYFWLVDPLDGTRNYIAGGSDYTVNIGLIHKGTPVLGVIYAPERGELYAGYTDEAGNRAFRYFEDSDTEKDMRVRRMPKDGLVVMSSGTHASAPRMDDFLQEFKIAKIIRRASSLKICAVAGGKADIYPRFGKTCEWDTAAGDAILRAAGGAIRDFKGQELVYGRSGPLFENPEFIAATQEIFELSSF